MEPWNSSRVLDFLIAHARLRISLRQRGTNLRLTGTLDEVGDRNACSIDLVEADLDLGIPGLQCALTLHEKSVLLHLAGGSGEDRQYFPVSISYPDLILERGESARPAREVQSSERIKRL